MKSAEIPGNESKRLEKLKALKVLDTPVEERFDRITRIVCKSLDVPIAAISLVDEDRQWFKSSQGLGTRETPRNIAFCAHAILDEGPFIVTDAAEDSRFKDNPLVTGGPGIRFYAGIPLDMGDGIRIGTLCAIDDKPRQISQEDIATLRDLADMVQSELKAISLSEAHVELIDGLEQAQRAAMIDPLTRLWNRRALEQLLEREWEFNTRNRSTMGLLIINIDHFEEISDNRGHPAGDEVLQVFASTLLQSLRPYDTVAHCDAGEFAVVLPGCERDVLQQTAERLLDSIRELTVHTGDADISVTASLGGICVSYREPGLPQDYLKLADHALYQARNSGGDQARIVGT